jgi:flagellar hook-associated protein 3 FlgL
MRITDNMLFNNFLYNINKINTKSFKTNSQLSSGRRLLNLDTDPIALMKVLSIKDIKSRFSQYANNINSANSVLDTQDVALDNADNLLQKADMLLIKGANDINSDTVSRKAIAQELDAVKKEIINSANTIFEGKYLFAGLKTDTQPIQNKPQAVAVTNKIISPSNQSVEVIAADNYKDINQFSDGNYTVKIENGKLSVLLDGKAIPIDVNSEDNSNVGGNSLSTSMDLTQENIVDKIKNNEWIDTGRGVKLRLKDLNTSDIETFSATLNISYTSGGKSVYLGDEGHRNVEYSDGLTSPISLNAKEIYKPYNQSIENSNYMIDKSTDDPVTNESKLTDIELSEALSRVKLETGSQITINGSDHNGNFVSGVVSVASDTTFQSLIDSVKNLDSVEMQKNNKVLTTTSGDVASAGDTLSNLGIGSNVKFFGFKSDTGSSVSFTVSASQTIASMVSLIGSNFNVDASYDSEHGLIKLKSQTAGESSLKVFAQTQTDKTAVFGSFIETSKGGSGGFKDVVDGYIEDGHLVFKDKRPGESKFNISFAVSDSSGSPVSNIFGVFNTKTLGRGVDVFKELRNAHDALLDDSYSLNQISKPTMWHSGTSYTTEVKGKYFGGIDDSWTLKVSNDSDDISAADGELKFNVESQHYGKNEASVSIIRSSGSYELTVKNREGYVIQHVTSGDLDSILGNIVINAKDYQTTTDKTQVNGVNGIQGVTLNFSKVNSESTFQKGDYFSFDVSNALERSIGKVKESLDQVLTSRAVVGARTNRMSLAKQRIDSITVTNSKTISELEDANMAEVFADFQRNQIVMQATLNAGSKLTSRNLFDYL